LAFVFSVLLTLPASAEDLSLEEVLRLAGGYVTAYEDTFALILTEGDSKQYLRYQRGGLPAQTRALRSDVAFLRLPGESRWLGFRDVFKADGRSVRQHEPRLQTLLAQSPMPALEQAEALLRQSARYNLGSYPRTFNVPMTPLLFLHPDRQYRFEFELKGTKKIEGKRCQILAYEETARPTLIRDGLDDVAARGRFFIAEDGGAVLRSELAFDQVTLASRVRITVSYRWVPKPGLWLPHEMRELYEMRQTNEAMRELPRDSFVAQKVEYIDCRTKYKGHRRISLQSENDSRLRR
jgi:hypothetical protein